MKKLGGENKASAIKSEMKEYRSVLQQKHVVKPETIDRQSTNNLLDAKHRIKYHILGIGLFHPTAVSSQHDSNSTRTHDLTNYSLF